MNRRVLQRIMMVVIITVVAIGASYNIIAADQNSATKTDAVLVMAYLQ